MRHWRRGNRLAAVIGLAGGVGLMAGVRSAPMQTFAKSGAEFGLKLQIGHALDTRQGRETAFAKHVRSVRSNNPKNASEKDASKKDAKNDFSLDSDKDFREGLVTAEEFTRLSESPDGARTQLADTFARILRLPPRPDGPTVMLIERETISKQPLEARDSPVPDLQMLSIGGISPLLSSFGYGQAEGRRFVSGKRLVGQGAVVPDAMINIGGYVALYGEKNKGRKGIHTDGSDESMPPALGVFALRSEIDTGSGNWQTLLLHTTLNTTLQGAMLNFGYHLPLQYLPEGTRFRQTFLLVRSPSDENASDCFTRIQRQFGLSGGLPAYTATMETGAITLARFPLDLAASEGAAVVAVSQTELPCALPVRVSGLRANWTTVCADLPANSKAVPLAPGTLPHRPVVALEGAACVFRDLNAHAGRLFLGHPAICDRPNVALRVTAWNQKGLTVEIHNPTTKSVTTHLRIHPRLGFGRQTLQIPARTSVTTQLSWQ